MTPLALFTTAYLTIVSANAVAQSAPGATAAPESAAELRDLKRQLRLVTAEADALWKYVGSGIDNPDIAALDRAAALNSQRRSRK